MATDGASEEKFLRVFLRNEDDLRSYARALMPNWEAVDEVMQEASVVMWRKLDQLREESEFLPWAKVIVRFESLKARRSFATDRHQFGDDVFELLAGDESDAGETDLKRERVALKNCLGKLDGTQRELVLTPYRSHGAVTDLAASSGRSVNSLYKKIGRLREKLTLCIQGQLGGKKLEEELS